MGRKESNQTKVTHIEVIRQNVFSHARVMVIGVSSDLNISNDLIGEERDWLSQFDCVCFRGSVYVQISFIRWRHVWE